MIKWLKFGLKWGLIGVALIVAVLVSINLWVNRSTRSRIHTSTAEVPKGRVGLLLGTSRKVAGGHTNLFFSNRIQAAVDLYRSGRITKIIVSGDNGIPEYNETEDMRNALIKKGIPSADIVNDHAGFRTLDSVLRAKLVFGQEKIVVISQKFHIQRALFIAHAHDIDAHGYVAADPPDSWSSNKVYVREMLARASAFLDCYILGTEPRFSGPPEPIEFD